MARESLSRRGFVTLSGMATATLIFGVDPAAATPIHTPGARSFSPSLSGTIATCFTEDWSSRVEVTFPGSVSIGSLGKPGHLQLTWDSRLFAVDDVFVQLTNGVLAAADATIREGSARVSDLEHAAAVFPVVRALTTYPSDALGDVAPTVVSTGDGARAIVLRPRVFAADPWGIELSATWIRTEAGVAADLIVIHSTGPRPVPTGVEIAVLEPARTQGDAKLEKGLRKRAPRAGQVIFELEKPLAAGTSIETAFGEAEGPVLAFRENDAPGIATVRATPTAWRSARDTGSYDSASVMDAAVAPGLATRGS